MSEQNCFYGLQDEIIEFKTSLGSFVWRPDWNEISKHVLSPVNDAVVEDERKFIGSQTRSIVRQYFKSLIVVNLQCATFQAAAELTAIAKAHSSISTHDRNKLAETAADEARDFSLARLRKLPYFRKPKQGEKKRLTGTPLMKQIIEEYLGLEQLVIGKIKDLLQQEKRKKDPTIGEVAKMLGMGDESKSGRDTGQIMLSLKLKKLRPGEKGKDVFQKLLEEAKRQLKEEY